MLFRKKIYRSLSIFFGLIILVCSGCANQNEVEKEICLKINGEEYIGECEISDNSENIIFKVMDKTKDIDNVQGKIVEGKLKGECLINYSDGSNQSGVMKNGKWNGRTILTENDGTLKRIYYKNGEPMGRILIESLDGKKTQDWYYNETLISDWIQMAEEHTAAEYYNEIFTFYDECVKVSGIVENVRQEGNTCIWKIVDDVGQKYFITYDNSIYKKEKVVIMPSVEIGERVNVYGFFKGLIQNNYKINGDEDYGFTFPNISALCGEIIGQNFDMHSVPNQLYEYEDILNNPFWFVNTSIEISGIVENVFRNDTDTGYYCRVNSNGQIYFLKLNLAKLQEKNLPVYGDKVQVQGKLYGNYCQKVYRDNEIETIVYPLINEPDYTILQ